MEKSKLTIEKLDFKKKNNNLNDEFDSLEKDSQEVSYERLGYYYDISTGICVMKMQLSCDLEIGGIYDFVFEKENNIIVATKIILKKEDNNVYYVADYYGKLIQTKHEFLSSCWLDCNVLEECGIDLEDWKKKILNIIEKG